MTTMLSLPASMQQELAARALRACMAAEAAMASLRAECKPLQTASPQRVLALNTKNMGNAHRSLQLQIEACESFSLSATAAFKQLCDVIFCTDSEKSTNLEHNSMLHPNTHFSKSSKAQLCDFNAIIDEELLDCRSRKCRINAPDQSKGDEEDALADDISDSRDHSAGVQLTEAQDTLLWGPEIGTAYSRFPSPDTDNEATTREEIVERRLIEDSDWSSHSTSQQIKYQEDSQPQFGNNIVMSKIHEDSDAASDVDVDLRCDTSSLRENSTLSTKFSINQLDDGYTLQKTTLSQSSSANTESSICAAAGEQGRNSSQIHQAITSDVSQFNSEHGYHATESIKIPNSNESAKSPSRLTGGADAASLQQTMDVDSSPYVSDAHSGVSSLTATGSPPPPSSSSNEITERCNSTHGPTELQPATPSFSTPVHSSWTMAEVTCTQTPCSSASRLSWSCETTRSMDTPSTTQPLSILEYDNPRVSYASAERWDPSKLSSELPLYPAHAQSTKSNGTNPSPTSSAVRSLYKPAVPSFESQDLALRTVQPLYNREIGHCPPSPSYADENQCVEPNVPLTPSPYTLKMKSMFSQANVARKSSPIHSVSAPMQSSYGQSDGSLFSMATSVPMSSGYRQPSSMSSRLPCGSSAFVSIMEKQALQLVSETPLRAQYSIYPISSSISTSSLSWESSPASSITSASDSSGREGSLDNYKRKLESRQEQFPRAHGSLRGESQSSWETSRFGTLVSKPVGNSSQLQNNSCKIPWQTSHMSTNTEVERYVGAASSSGSTFEARDINAERRPPEGGAGYIQDRSMCCGSKGSLESEFRYDGIMQGSRISECHVSEVGDRELSHHVTNRTDSGIRPDDNQSSKEEPEAPVPDSSSCWTSGESMAMVGGGAGDNSWARVESTMSSSQLSDESEPDDDDDDESTEREWNNILIGMQQRGKPKLASYPNVMLDSSSLKN